MALDADRLARCKRFTWALDRAGMSREDLAAKLHVSPSTVWRWERKGAVPGGDVLGALADYCRVDADWLLRGIGSPERSDPYPAWRAFLEGDYPEKRMLEPWMREELEVKRFPPGAGEPTVETYCRLVSAYATLGRSSGRG